MVVVDSTTHTINSTDVLHLTPAVNLFHVALTHSKR